MSFLLKRLHDQKLAALVKKDPEKVSEGEKSLFTDLKEDLLAIEKMDSHKKRAVFKKEQFGKYRGWVMGKIQSDSSEPDRIVSEMLVWSIDAKMIESAVAIAEYMVKHDLKPPTRFNRTVATLVAEEFANDPTDITADQFEMIAGFLNGKDVVDKVQAKFGRAYGEAILVVADETKDIALYERVTEIFNKALVINPGVGVKGTVKTIKKTIQELSSPP